MFSVVVHVDSLLFCFQSILLNGMFPSIFSKTFIWVKDPGYCGAEFKERSENIWVLVRCWDKSQFLRVCVAILSRFSSNVNQGVSVLGWIIDASGSNVCVVSFYGGPHALTEGYLSYRGSRYHHKLMEYPFLFLRLFKRCLQQTTSSVFGSLDPTSGRIPLWQNKNGKVVIGWFAVPHWRRPSSLVISPCRISWKSWPKL